MAACAVALQLGFYIGHTGKLQLLGINIANIGRAVPSYAVMVMLLPVMLGLAPTDAGAPAAVVAALRAVLLRLNESEAGRRILDQFEQTAKFDEIPEGGEQALSQIISRIQYVESDLGQ